MAATVQTFGTVHHALNFAAAYEPRHGTLECTVADWDRIVGVTLRGTWLVSKHALRVMRENPPIGEKGWRGSIVTVASAVAHRGGGNFVAYTAAKAGVLGLTRAMAVDAAPYRVRVNCLSPGLTRTPATPLAPGSEAEQEAVARAHLLPYMAEPEDLAQAAPWVCSDAARCLTGAIIPVDCGWTARCVRHHAHRRPRQWPSGLGPHLGRPSPAPATDRRAAPGRGRPGGRPAMGGPGGHFRDTLLASRSLLGAQTAPAHDLIRWQPLDWAQPAPTAFRLRLRAREHPLLGHLLVDLDPATGLLAFAGALEHTGDGPPVALAHAGNSLAVLLPSHIREVVHLAGRWGAETQVQRLALPRSPLLLESRAGKTGFEYQPYVALLAPGWTYLVELLWSGNWQIHLRRLPDGRVALSSGLNPWGFRHRLGPGQRLDRRWRSWAVSPATSTPPPSGCTTGAVAAGPTPTASPPSSSAAGTPTPASRPRRPWRD